MKRNVIHLLNYLVLFVIVSLELAYYDTHSIDTYSCMHLHVHVQVRLLKDHLASSSKDTPNSSQHSSLDQEELKTKVYTKSQISLSVSKHFSGFYFTTKQLSA